MPLPICPSTICSLYVCYRNSLKSSSCCYKWLDFILFFKSESEVTQLCPTLCNPMGCSLQGSFVHRILQAGILEWVAIPFSRGSSRPKDQTGVSRTAGKLFIIWTTRELPTNALFSMAITLNEWYYTVYIDTTSSLFIYPYVDTWIFSISLICKLWGSENEVHISFWFGIFHFFR